MGKIKDLPMSDRPREKALAEGVDKLSDSELLAIILGSGCKNKSALELSMEMICMFKGLANIFQSNTYELNKCNGISNVKALRILAISELFVRIHKSKETIAFEKIKICCALDVYNYMYLKFASLINEQLCVLYLNNQNIIIYEEVISIGNDVSTINNNKQICKTCVEKYAKKIIVTHNHPSGNASPSLDDVNAYFCLFNALKYIDVKLLDHVIIGNKEYYSLKDEKKFKV